MSSRAQKLKSIVKGVESKPTFGINPMDPWSAKAGISESESGLLKRYLLSRGIDPRYVTKDTRISHAKSGQFLKWKADHISDRVTNEEVDKEDTITFDIPLIIRVMELAREDLKSDMDLHKVVEKLINIRNQGVLTMDDYDYISNIKEDVMSSVSLEYIKEALSELMSEISVELQHSYFKKAHAQKYDKTGTTPKATKQKRNKGMEKVVSRTLKRNVIGLPKGVDPSEGGKYTADSVEVEGTPLQEGSAALRMAKALQKAKQERELKDQSREAREKQQTTPVKEESCSCGMKRSNSAKIIKSLYKKVNMKEDMYDFEKDDKSIETYGKKPKVNKMDKDAEPSKSKIQAAAVLSGGTTLTGQSRDTVEIDPIMRVRPGQTDPTKNEKK